MADFGIWTKNADIQARAGVDANATSKATAATDVYVLNVEALINVLTRYDWSGAVTKGLDVATQGILVEASASLCAIKVINSDLDSFPTRIIAETMMDVLRDDALRAISILRDKENQKFIDDKSTGTI